MVYVRRMVVDLLELRTWIDRVLLVLAVLWVLAAAGVIDGSCSVSVRETPAGAGQG